MRLSISSRIFAGFLVVLIAFSGVMAYTFHRMHQLRQDLHLINSVYIKLTLRLAELSALQGNIPNPVAERSAGRGTDSYLLNQVREARIFRLRDVKRAIKLLHDSRALDTHSRDQEFLARTEQRLRDLERGFTANETAFDQLFSERGPPPLQEAQKVGEMLVRSERKLLVRIRQLRDDLTRQVRAAALKVEESENNATWATLMLAMIVILISLSVTFGVQLMLRPLRILVAGTKRIGSGDYEHRVVVSSRDELGVLGREFNSMAQAIEEREQRLIRSERMAAAGQFASHITHEIRNPLSSISLNTELLEEEFTATDEESEAKNLCRAIRREIDRLTDITEEYLRFARLPRPHLEAEEINEILLNLLSFMSSELREKKVEVKYDLQQPLPTVEVDENQLRQAFLNLLRNAGEAMAAGGTLIIKTRQEDKWIAISIEDTGQGISDADLSLVFDPFFSTKETGTGLGLALTQQIVQEHGGNITVSSVPAQGTTFTIRLPVQSDQPKT